MRARVIISVDHDLSEQDAELVYQAFRSNPDLFKGAANKAAEYIAEEISDVLSKEQSEMGFPTGIRITLET